MQLPCPQFEVEQIREWFKKHKGNVVDLFKEEIFIACVGFPVLIILYAVWEVVKFCWFGGKEEKEQRERKERERGAQELLDKIRTEAREREEDEIHRLILEKLRDEHSKR